MELWLKTCLILCSYGFFKEIRPSEPYITEYLLGPQQNLTENQVYYGVYPVWTYSYLCLLILVFLLTDLVRYKPVIIFEGIGYVATWCLLLWARGFRWMQFMQFIYGIATSTEVAYYTYIYAQVDKKYYQKVTSYTRAAFLAGRFISGVSSQLLYSFGILDYHSLNYVSFASLIIAFFVSLVLPPVKTSIYFHRDRTKPQNDGSADERQALKGEGVTKSSNSVCNVVNIKRAISLLWGDFKQAYSNRHLVKWSIWWACATCINFQVGNYIQPLWESIAPFHQTEILYNGVVEASSTLLSAALAFAVGYLRLNWTLIGESVLAVLSFADAVLLAFAGTTNYIWVAYVNYIAFRVSYQVLITVASFQVAKELKADSYGLVFGVNMFLALLLQTILTVVVVEWLEIRPGLQFVIYGAHFAVLSALFIVFSSYKLCSSNAIEVFRQDGIWERRSPAVSSISEQDFPNGYIETDKVI